MKLIVFQQLHKVKSSQTKYNSPHDHNAWRPNSLAQEQQSHSGFSIMVRHTKFSFVGREFQQALPINFFILFGTCIDQMPHYNSLSFINRAETLAISSFDFKNRYPDLLVYIPV